MDPDFIQHIGIIVIKHRNIVLIYGFAFTLRRNNMFNMDGVVVAKLGRNGVVEMLFKEGLNADIVVVVRDDDDSPLFLEVLL